MSESFIQLFSVVVYDVILYVDVMHKVSRVRRSITERERKGVTWSDFQKITIDFS